MRRPKKGAERPRARRDERAPASDTRVLPGPRFVLEALRGPHARHLRALYVEDLRRAEADGIVAAARAANVRVETRSRDALDGLSQGARHQGVLAIAGSYPYVALEDLLEGTRPLLVALDEITDPHNFGAILRSAVAFGADGVLIPEHRSAPVTGVVVRASAGASERARIARVTNLQRTLAELAERGLQIVGLDGSGTVSVADLPPAPAGRVLVIGSEGEGLRRLVRERCDVLARVPQTDAIESLNASVAAGIALYEAARARS